MKFTEDEIDKIIEMAEQNEAALGDHMEYSQDVSKWVFEKKQQILENQEKLQKIKEWIFHEELLIKKYLKENNDWAKCEDDCIAELKEILGDDLK